MNRKYFGNYLFWLLVLVTSLSCEEKRDWDFKPQENGNLVVDAVITNEFKFHEIRLSLSFSEQNGQLEVATGAEIIASDGQNSLNFIEDVAEAGRYVSELPFAAQFDKTYSIEIQYKGQTYQAQNEMAQVFPLERITFHAYGNSDSLTIGNVAPIYSPNEQAMYEINIYWSHLTNVEPNHAKLFYYTFSTLDVNELFPPDKETVVFPKGSIVIEKKHSLNDDFAAFYRALVMETEWQGGVYDENSASLPTNISNGGLGFFGVSAVLSDTLIAE